jgi:hypothetical protein
MPFSTLAQIDLSEDWQITPVTEGNYFRFVYRNNAGFSYLAVAQAQVGNDGLELFGSFRFFLKGQGADVAELEIPRVFNSGQRCLAVRGVGPARTQAAKSLDLLIEATSIMILNPNGATTKEKVTNFLQSDNLSREMVPATADRNGGIIFNKGTKALWVGFGVPAEKSSVQKILPGGQMDIPNGFTGVINGIFDAAEAATATSNSKAIVVEMVAS